MCIRDRLYPLTYLRPAYELKCGHISLRQRIEKMFPEFTPYYFMRDYLAPVFSKKLSTDRINQTEALKGDDLLIINGRLLAIDIKIDPSGPDQAGIKDNDLVYARLNRDTIDQMTFSDWDSFLQQLKSKIPTVDIDVPMIDFPWNLVQNNGRAIKTDFAALPQQAIFGELSAQAAIIGDKNQIYMAESSSVRPFVTLDTTNGPIIFEKNVIIHPMTHIEGPCSLDENTQVYGGNIREGCAIGPMCRIHGEIEESIIHGYSNKHHDGFLGHAYLGEWVNLGAFTTNSDLKNDYTSVKLYVKGDLVDSGDLKVGSIIGDHTKTSIGTVINTGAMIGIMSNLVGSGNLIPKFIPSYCWYLNDKVTKGFGLTHMIETAAKSMSRRKVELTPEEQAMLNHVFDITREERRFWIKKSFS